MFTGDNYLFPQTVQLTFKILNGLELAYLKRLPAPMSPSPEAKPSQEVTWMANRERAFSVVDITYAQRSPYWRQNL